MSNFAILFLVFFVAGVIRSLFKSAIWGICLYVIVYFLNPFKRWWYGELPALSYSFYIVVVIMISIFIHKNKDKDVSNKIMDAPQTKWLILLLCIYGVTYFTALSPSFHLVALTQFFKLIVIIFLMYLVIDTEKKLDFVLIAYLIGATYIGWECYVVGRDGMGRVEGVGTIDSPDANGAASVIVPSVALLIYYGWRSAFKMKLVYLFFAVWIMNGLVLLNSRGAFLGILVGAGYMIFHMLFSRVKIASQRVSALLVIFFGITTAFYLTDDVFWNRMDTLQNIEDERKSGSYRMWFWLKTVDMIESRPLGLGARGYEILSPLYIEEEYLSPQTKTRAVHSLWFQCLSEVGWFGFLSFILLIFSSFNLSRKVKKCLVLSGDVNAYFRIVAVESAFIGYLVTCSFINQFRAEILYWFIIFIACLGNIHIFRKTRDSIK